LRDGPDGVALEGVTRSRAWRIAMTSVALVSSACASTPSDDPVGRAREVDTSVSPRIIRGTPSGADQDSVVMIAIWNERVRVGICTGSVIAPTLVLTARHCVSFEGPGNVLNGDRAPGDLDVRVGGGAATGLDDRATATAKGKRLFVPEADTVFNADLAVIEVDRPLGVEAASLRLGADVAAGEELTLVGWGATENGRLPSSRMQRVGVKVEAVGVAASTSDFDVGADEFRIGEGTCFGDSGGPSLSSRTGAIVGIVSRGGNGVNDPNDVAAACVGPKVADVHTMVGRFRPIVEGAFKATGATPRPEQAPPDPVDEGCAASPARARTATASHLVLAALALSLAGRRLRRARPSRAR
jgi:hypothetical protein